jgi:hypothetical protein
MKKTFFLVIAFVAIFSIAKSQSSAKSVYFELGTPGIASINYDMRLQNKSDGLGFRVGVGGVTIDGTGAVFIPLGLTYLIGKDNKNYFELGAGGTVLITFEKDFYSNGTTTSTRDFNSSFGHVYFGYRHQPQKDGFVFRAGIAPIFGKGFFIPYIPSLSFGYKF